MSEQGGREGASGGPPSRSLPRAEIAFTAGFLNPKEEIGSLYGLDRFVVIMAVWAAFWDKKKTSPSGGVSVEEH